MRRFKLHTCLLLFTVLSYLLSSCSIAKKTKENRVVGIWNVINVIDMGANTTEQWIFDPEGIVIIQAISDTLTVGLEVGTWAITQKINTAYINTEFGTGAAQQAGINVEWEILFVKKETMTLTHQEGGLLTMEFEKVN